MLGEFELIAQFFSRPPRRPDVVLGVGDDAALIRMPAGRQLVAAVDTLVAGVHYPLNTAPADIGYRALAVNLSDLAAMGAEPAWATLSLSMSRADTAWLEEFARGLYELAAAHAVDLVGGDTVRGPEVITVQLLGMVEENRSLRRSGARPGDRILVSGVPGEAAAGLEIIQKSLPGDAAAVLKARFLRPSPRIALGRKLLGRATAAMDVSDGLLTDLDKLCAASACGAELKLEALPGSAAMQRLFDAARCETFALHGGDDYELLFTAPEAEAAAIVKTGFADVACTVIGSISAQHGVRCTRQGKPVPMTIRGYDHFAAATVATGPATL